MEGDAKEGGLREETGAQAIAGGANHTLKPKKKEVRSIGAMLLSPVGALLCICAGTLFYGAASTFSPPPFGANAGANAAECAGPDFQ